MPILKIDLYTDVSCPWCLIGQHRLNRVLAERFSELAIDIEHHPVLLVPDVPSQGIRIADFLNERYGIEDPSASWVRPEAEARASGLNLDLKKQPFLYPTLPAHTLIRLARQRGTQHAIALALSTAYFLEARNISDPDVLANVGASHGFDRSEVKHLVRDTDELQRTLLDVTRSEADGVRSVPHFVFDGRLSLNGGRSEDDLAAAIQAASSTPSKAS